MIDINTFNLWSDVNNKDINSLVDLIITNGTVESIDADYWLVPNIGDPKNEMKILDFGCGVGRNIFGLSKNIPCWSFVGYDNPNMINKSNEYVKIKYGKSIGDFSNVSMIPDWNVVKNIKFDCIYATLVFQHILECHLAEYLRDIKLMTTRLVVSGRRFNDDVECGRYKNTWLIMENNGYFPTETIGLNYSVHGDPNDHMTCIYNLT